MPRRALCWARFAALALFSASCATMPAPAWQLEPGGAAIPRGYAFPMVAEAAPQPPPPPVSLTASDGAGLRLAELSAHALVEDPLAFTELHLAFDNPDDRTLEGTFSITLPAGAAISRLAMRLGDDWQEGEVVEKKTAREAYEDFLHRRQDPALLEQAAGNQLSARVFPIPARGRKELIVSYSQELTEARPYVLPLRGLPELGRLDVAITLSGQASPVQVLSRTAFTPGGDLRLEQRRLTPNAGLRNGNLVLARVRPLPNVEPDPLGPTVVLLDTSASRALGFDEQLRLFDQLVHGIAAASGAKTPLAVVCFDQTAEAVFEDAAGAWDDEDVRRVRERQAFGASNLARALGWVQEHAARRGYKRVVLVGDGVATAGETSAWTLGALAAGLGKVGIERLDAVSVGGLRDDPALRKLATAGLPRDGVVAEGHLGAEGILQKLSLVTRSGIDVKVEGARWQWPERLDGVQPGDEVLVYADVPEDQPVRVRVDGALGPPLALRHVARPLLERSWAKAKIAGLLEQQGPEPQPRLLREVVALSTAFRVLSPYTSLLVLETDQDYARFQLDRKALASILTVDGGKLAAANRKPPSNPGAPGGDERMADARRRGNAAPLLAPPRPAPAPPPAHEAPAAVASAAPAATGNSIHDSFGAGGLGLTGVGQGGGGRGQGIGLGAAGTTGRGAGIGRGQGFGSGQGRISGSHRAATPKVRMGATQVSGRLSPDAILPTVRRSFGRLRACYENGLRTSPGLQGRVAMRFVISHDGSVASAANAGSNLQDTDVLECVRRVFLSMRFPPPEGGIITVTYPIIFTPGGDGSGERAATLSAEDVPPPREVPKPVRADPYTGRFKTVMELLSVGNTKTAVESAFAWHHEEPGDVMALVALGEALEAEGAGPAAARVYGSLIDLFPARADLRRFAGERLERIKGDDALALAIDTFAKAVEDRPDHPESHRLLAFARLRKGDHLGAFNALLRGMDQRYPRGRFRGVDRIMREDLGLIAAAWIKAEPKRRDEILANVASAGGVVEDAPSLRFVLSWETDANDVDFHIEDAEGGHAYYQTPALPSGGDLYADVTTGYGPECFNIRLPRDRRSAVYKLRAHYYARGPMGYGMGKLEIIDHDGKGGLSFEQRPYVVMADHAFVDLGAVTR